MNSYTVKVCVTDNMDKKHYSEKIWGIFLKDDFFKKNRMAMEKTDLIA